MFRPVSIREPRRAPWLLAGLVLASALTIGGPALAAAALAPSHVGWVEYVKALWPVIVVVAGLILTGLLLGLATRFTTVKAFAAQQLTVADHAGKIVDHETRLRLLEQDCDAKPSRQDLGEEVAELGERMRGVEVGISGLSSQANTTNTYLQTLIQRGLSGS